MAEVAEYVEVRSA